jgi:hypothetical protein
MSADPYYATDLSDEQWDFLQGELGLFCISPLMAHAG